MNLHRFILLTIVIVYVYQTCSAQFLPGAKQIALAHSDIANVSDVFSAFTNPAGLAKINSFEMGVYYSPSPFGLKQLSNGFGGASNNFNFGTLAACFSTYGFDLYKENKISLSFAKEIQTDFYAGISIFYNSLSIHKYGNDNTFLITIGTSAKLADNITIGFTAENLTRSTYGNDGGQIPSYFRSGVSYNIASEFIVHLALEKEIQNPLSVKFGLEFEPIEFINLRLGVMNEPDTFSGGLGILYSYFRIDYAFFTHHDLGLTHQAGLIINF
ncbi:MAG: hypothetical protein KJ571_08790 [Bacteroidetes bacterium]|nr:hypothetical protein [Bacteroidota bacterium]